MYKTIQVNLIVNYRQFKNLLLFGLEERQVAGNPKQKDDLPHGTARKQGYLFSRICANLCSSVGVIYSH